MARVRAELKLGLPSVMSVTSKPTANPTKLINTLSRLLLLANVKVEHRPKIPLSRHRGHLNLSLSKSAFLHRPALGFLAQGTRGALLLLFLHDALSKGRAGSCAGAWGLHLQSPTPR